MEILLIIGVLVAMSLIAYGIYPNKEKKRYTIKLTIKAVIRWEQLNRKPFSSLDYTSEDDIISLFYVCALSDNMQFTLAEFKENIKIEDIKRMVNDFERQTSITSQFQIPTKEKSNESDESDESNAVYIKDIVSMLVMNGLDVYYAIDTLELCDLPIFLQAYDEKRKVELEYQRLWAFIPLSINLPKGTTPQDICPFSWEKKDEAISESENMEGQEELKAFVKNGLN